VSRGPVWTAAGLVLAAALAAAWGFVTSRGPVLWQVSPEPGATLMLRETPLEAQLTAPYAGIATLYLDGKAVLSGLPAPLLSALPARPLATGPHVLRVQVALPGRTYTYRWRVSVAKNAQSRVAPYDPATYLALGAVNSIRATAGLASWRLSLPLEGAARAHSQYFLGNLSRFGTLTDAAHQEQPGWPLFTGRTPWARDVAFGFNGDGDSEVMAFGVDTAEAVELWLDSVYHRFGLLDPGLTSMGFGIAGGTSGRSDDLPVTTLNAGFEAQAEVQNGRAVVWPVPGQTGIPVEFEAGEMPDPLANFPGARYPAGYPVTVSFFGLGVQALSVSAATLTAHGQAVPANVLTPAVEHNPDELGMSMALLPKAPLQHRTGYEAAVSGRYRDQDGWHSYRIHTNFTTA